MFYSWFVAILQKNTKILLLVEGLGTRHPTQAFQEFSWNVIIFNLIEVSSRHNDRYLQNGASENIVLVIRHANFQLYKAHSDGVT